MLELFVEQNNTILHIVRIIKRVPVLYDKAVCKVSRACVLIGKANHIFSLPASLSFFLRRAV